MSEPETEALTPVASKARMALLRRLIDTVAMPASRISPQDRSMAGDILIDMLFHASDRERGLCATRLQNTVEAPARLMRYLAQCRFEIAQPLLEENKSFSDSDMCDIIRLTGLEHHMAIAARRSVSVTVSDCLIGTREPETIRILLNSKGAELSELGVDALIELSMEVTDLCALIARRPETKPAQAMAMFWWADGPTRKTILTKHSADRDIIIDLCADIFSQFTADDWNDPIARKALQMIERRQRNRSALDRSEFDSLEDAVRHMATVGMSPELMQELGYLVGMKPVSVAKLMGDPGGEGIAVLCKATGLKRRQLAELWRSIRRPLKIDGGTLHPQFAYVLEIYDLMTVVKAQTVLRYWNWSLTPSGVSGGSPVLEGQIAAFSSSKRMHDLVFRS